ncbi:large ribosomal subunit protein mL46-like [Mytilus galloprovincialis]|uniref:large ribosomal subunit protein mL46-like n=1 Tax=Mytilus galloprovincialis TaxID=29158 RepID=UPI003F7C224E
MIRYVIPRLSKRVKSQKVCCFCAKTHVTTTQPTNWKIAAAVCVERYPVITQDLTDIEKRYQDMCSKIDVENSLLSVHEEKIESEKKKMKAKKEKEEKGDKEDQSSKDISAVTAFDKEDHWEKEVKEYQIPSRITEADKKNDMKSPKRKLDRKLVLIVQEMVNGKEIWKLPDGYYNNEETLKETAENALQQRCGTTLKSNIFGNAPHGLFKYKLPLSVRETENAEGVKIFIYKAEFKDGNVDLKDKEILDYKWVTLEELSEYVTPQFEKTLKEFVLEF